MPRKRKSKRGKRGRRLMRARGYQAVAALHTGATDISVALHSILRTTTGLMALAKVPRKIPTPLKVSELAPASCGVAALVGSDAKVPVKGSLPDELVEHTAFLEDMRAWDAKASESRWSDVEDSENDYKDLAIDSLRGLRAMFKADTPYRCRLSYFITIATSSSGVLNFTYNLSSIASSPEWGSIDALFDEFFIHSCRMHFMPYQGASGAFSTGNPNGMPTIAGATNSYITAVGLIWVSLFNAGGSYSSASQMLNNPTRKLTHSSRVSNYIWRNNVRFDPRGPNAAVLSNWQGWTPTNSVSSYGGTIQVRAALDEHIGDLAHVYTLGDVAVDFDVSFRARS